MTVRIKKYKCGIVTVSTIGKTPKPKPKKHELKFKIKWKHYRQIASSLAEMWEQKTNMLTFFTFTVDYPYPEKAVNYCLSKLLENLRKNHGLGNYLWVLELQENGNPHYHCVFDMPFFPLQDGQIDKSTGELFGKGLNTVWVETLRKGLPKWICSKNKAQKFETVIDCGLPDTKEWDLEYFNAKYSKIMEGNKNAVRLPKKKKGKKYRAEIDSLQGLTRYLCKYLSKQMHAKTEFNARCYGMTRAISVKPELIELDELEKIMMSGKVKKVYNREYSSIICFGD